MKEPRTFDRYCPLRNITRHCPPTQLWHGDKDTDVPFQESVDMSAELQRKHLEHELMIVPVVGHGFRMTDDQFTKELEFLHKHLQ